MSSSKPKSVYLLSQISYDRIYGANERQDIARLTTVQQPLLNEENWSEHPDICGQTEIIFSGWGMPVTDSAFLSAFPRLRAIFYGAGTVKGFATDELWERGILLTSASTANAVPVCEFTLAQIILALKHFWRLSAATHSLRSYPEFMLRESPGMYQSVVGLISLGSIGRMVAERLRSFDVQVIAYDPMADPQQAASLGVGLCSLQELFRRADVISCHTPWLKQTEHLLTADLFLAMKPDATFINTSRGIVVDEPGLIKALTRRPDIHAILDVTYPEPPEPDSPLYTLPNVRLTPHIAGSKGNECHRMGRMMVDELKRYLSNEPLAHGVTRERIASMA